MFITNKQHNVTKVPVLTKEEGIPVVEKYLSKCKEFSLDFETPNVDPKTKQTLLCAINNHIDDFIIVIDTVSVPFNT